MTERLSTRSFTEAIVASLLERNPVPNIPQVEKTHRLIPAGIEYRSFLIELQGRIFLLARGFSEEGIHDIAAIPFYTGKEFARNVVLANIALGRNGDYGHSLLIFKSDGTVFTMKNAPWWNAVERLGRELLEGRSVGRIFAREAFSDYFAKLENGRAERIFKPSFNSNLVKPFVEAVEKALLMIPIPEVLKIA